MNIRKIGIYLTMLAMLGITSAMASGQVDNSAAKKPLAMLQGLLKNNQITTNGATAFNNSDFPDFFNNAATALALYMQMHSLSIAPTGEDTIRSDESKELEGNNVKDALIIQTKDFITKGKALFDANKADFVKTLKTIQPFSDNSQPVLAVALETACQSADEGALRVLLMKAVLCHVLLDDNKDVVRRAEQVDKLEKIAYWDSPFGPALAEAFGLLPVDPAKIGKVEKERPYAWFFGNKDKNLKTLEKQADRFEAADHKRLIAAQKAVEDLDSNNDTANENGLAKYADAIVALAAVKLHWPEYQKTHKDFQQQLVGDVSKIKVGDAGFAAKIKGLKTDAFVLGNSGLVDITDLNNEVTGPTLRQKAEALRQKAGEVVRNPKDVFKSKPSIKVKAETLQALVVLRLLWRFADPKETKNIIDQSTKDILVNWRFKSGSDLDVAWKQEHLSIDKVFGRKLLPSSYLVKYGADIAAANPKVTGIVVGGAVVGTLLGMKAYRSLKNSPFTFGERFKYHVLRHDLTDEQVNRIAHDVMQMRAMRSSAETPQKMANWGIKENRYLHSLRPEDKVRVMQAAEGLVGNLQSSMVPVVGKHKK